jgi:HAD superfamily hydrolase (TIGR01509 family)
MILHSTGTITFPAAFRLTNHLVSPRKSQINQGRVFRPPVACAVVPRTGAPLSVCYSASMGSREEMKGVLFDWDGTLIDSYHADSQAYLAMFRDMGLAWGLAELEQNYSPDWYAVYRAAGIAKERWSEADLAWRKHYAKHPSKLMNGAQRILQELAAKHRLGLVTSGDRERVSRQLQEFQLADVFETYVCGGDTNEKKPRPEPLLLALRQMNIDARHCVYVGDTPEDLLMARAAGVRPIAVLGPFPTEQRLRAAEPEYLLGSLEELPELLKKISDESNT